MLALCDPSEDSHSSHLISKVYASISTVATLSQQDKWHYFNDRAILAPLNAEVDVINNSCLAALPGEANTYLSADTAIDDTGTADHSYPPEYLNTITFSGMPPHSLCLKPGCPIILLRSLDFRAGLCNGTRLIITALKDRLVEAKILSGTHAGTAVFIPRINLMNNPAPNIPFHLRRRQLPFRLAFAMSINKSQGQSVPILGIQLSTPVFAHGQLYVALSRAGDYQQIYISAKGKCFTKNIVYREVLS